SHGQDHVFNRVSRGFFRDAERRLSRYPRPPSVFLVGRFTQGTSNADLLSGQPHPLGEGTSAPTFDGVAIGRDVMVLFGPHAAPIDPHAARFANLIGARDAAALAN